MPNHRSFPALAACAALAVLAPCQAQTPSPPTAAALALRNPDNDRLTLAEAIQSHDIDKATRILDADPPIIKMLDRQNRLPLTEAIEHNWGEYRTSMLALLLARGADINASDRQGQTPLILDVTRGTDQEGKVFDFLLSKGASLTAAGTDGQTPLHAAAAQHNLDLVNRLLAHGVSPNLRDKKENTPLHAAVFSGDPQIVSALLNSGADVNLRNGRGDMPLHLALREAGLPGNPAAAHGKFGLFDSNYRPDSGGADGALSGRKIVGLLLTHGANVDLRDQYGQTPLLYTLLNRDSADRLRLLKNHALVDTQTAFFQAAALDDVPTLTRLARANPALPTLRAASGATPLHVAALWNARRAIIWLLKHGDETTDRDAYALSPLHYACRTPAALGAAQDLIAAGANVSAESGAGETPLFYAVRAGANDTALLLLDHHAAANTPNDNGETPLMVVPDFHRAGLVAALLKAGADPNAHAHWGGQTILTNAVSQGSPETVTLLLKAGADPDYTVDGDATALERAIHLGKKDMVILLLNAGADPRQNLRGLTPLGMAAASPDKSIAALLQAKLDEAAK